MKKVISFCILLFFAFTSCNKQEDTLTPDAVSGVLVKKKSPPALPEGNPYTKARIDAYITDFMNTTGDFRWEWMDLKLIWSALQYDEQIVALGYKPASDQRVSEKLHTINISAGAYKATHDALLDFILSELNKYRSAPLTLEDILVEDDPVLPVLTLRLNDKNVLTALAGLENVRYIEPLGYWPSQIPRSSSGCSNSSVGINTFDYSTVAPASLLPWNFNLHQVPAAWNSAQGAGITIGVIDAGLSSGQTLLGSQFNDGYSNVGRTLTTDYTFGTSAYASCSHGTSMSALAVGPRNAQNATTGVAYKSNLHFIRAADDVVLDLSSEISAVKNAFVKMGNNRNVRIISLSMGTPFGSSLLKDGVDYAYGKGKIIYAAAGTSFGLTSWWGVIYPAAYSSCRAVTGVKENGSRCASCHDGSAVIYTVTMERDADSDRNSLALMPSGTTPSYIGGSSAATATAAGIAALVWSARPGMTRAQLENCLTRTAQFYPTRTSTKGYGNLNASAALNYAVTYY